MSHSTMQGMKVLPLGTDVFVGAKQQRDIPGEITGITIRSQRIVYEIAWWDGTTRKTEWLGEEEFLLKDKVKHQTIGFVA